MKINDNFFFSKSVLLRNSRINLKKILKRKKSQKNS